MFRKIKAERIVITLRSDRLVLSYKLKKEEDVIKAAGRISLGKFVRVSGVGEEWHIEGDVLTLEIPVASLKRMSVGQIQQAFEEMTS